MFSLFQLGLKVLHPNEYSVRLLLLSNTYRLTELLSILMLLPYINNHIIYSCGSIRLLLHFDCFNFLNNRILSF